MTQANLCLGCPAFRDSALTDCSEGALLCLEGCPRVIFQPEALIVSNGAGESNLYCISRGLAYDRFGERQDPRVPDGLYGPGDILPTAIFGGDVVSNAEIRAVGEVEACVISGERIARMELEDASFCHSLSRYLARRDQRRRQTSALFRNSSAGEKIRSLLAQLSREYGPSLQLDRKQLSLLSGLTLETISRTLTRLERSGSIRRFGWKVEVERI